jgi:hypothetical protein
VTYRTQDPAALQARIAELEVENAELWAKLESRGPLAAAMDTIRAGFQFVFHRQFAAWTAWVATPHAVGYGLAALLGGKRAVVVGLSVESGVIALIATCALLIWFVTLPFEEPYSRLFRRDED